MAKVLMTGIALVCVCVAIWAIDLTRPRRIAERVERAGAFGLRELWADLGIAAELDLTNADRRLSAEIMALPAVPGRRLCEIIAVTDGIRWDWQYLVFEREYGVWRFVGHIDLPCQKYEKPTFRFVVIAPGVYCMVIRSLAGSGTGLLKYEEAWYEWKAGRINEILNIPIEGHVVGWGMAFDRKFRSEITEERDSAEGFSVLVRLHETYSQPEHIDEPDFGFSENHTIVFTWDSAKRQFRNDPARSDMAPHELQGVWDDGTPEFAVRHLEHIKKILDSGTPSMRQWCFNILDEAIKAASKREARSSSHIR